MLTVLGHMYIIVHDTAALGAFPLPRRPFHPIPAQHSLPFTLTTPAVPRPAPSPPVTSRVCLHFCTITRPISTARTPDASQIVSRRFGLALRIRACCHCRGLRGPTPHPSHWPHPPSAGIPSRCFWNSQSGPVSSAPLPAATGVRTAWPLVGSPAAQLTTWRTSIALRHRRPPRTSAGASAPARAAVCIALRSRRAVRLCTTSCPTAKALTVRGRASHSLAH
jgi:hypothetical protein